MTPFAMVYTMAVGVPIACAALAVAAVLRRYGRPERGVWIAGLVLALIVPVIGLMAPSSHAVDGATSTPEAQVGVIGLPEFVVVPAAPATSLDWGRVVLLAWLVVSSVLALRWAVASYRLSRASRSWASGTIDGVAVSMTDDVGPAVAGTFRPRVLAPSWLGALPARERSLVLMHEQEHIRARDPLLIALTRVVRVLVPWNPIVWLLTSRLVRAIELDCDRRVLRRTADVAAYGNTLLAVSRRRPGRLVAVAAFAESEAPLRQRILSMTMPSKTVSVVAIVASTVLGVVLLIGALQIPVPTVSLEFSLEPATGPTPSQTGFDMPPTPPAPPTPTTVIEQPVTILSQVPRPAPEPVVEEPAPPELAPAVESTEPENILVPLPRVRPPEFTPMTVRPVLTNGNEVQQALMREYPAVLRDAGIGGAPVLWIHIATDGSVDETRIHETSGQSALDEAAQRVAEAMRFRPAQNSDDVVAVWVQIPIRFAVVN